MRLIIVRLVVISALVDAVISVATIFSLLENLAVLLLRDLILSDRN